MNTLSQIEKMSETVGAANRWLVAHATLTVVKEYGPKIALEMVRSLSDTSRDDASLWVFWSSVEAEVEALMNAFEGVAK